MAICFRGRKCTQASQVDEMGRVEIGDRSRYRGCIRDIKLLKIAAVRHRMRSNRRWADFGVYQLLPQCIDKVATDETARSRNQDSQACHDQVAIK